MLAESHEDPFLEVIQKRSSWENICTKIGQNFSGNFGKQGQKLSHLRKFPCSYSHASSLLWSERKERHFYLQIAALRSQCQMLIKSIIICNCDNRIESVSAAFRAPDCSAQDGNVSRLKSAFPYVLMQKVITTIAIIFSIQPALILKKRMTFLFTNRCLAKSKSNADQVDHNLQLW